MIKRPQRNDHIDENLGIVIPKSYIPELELYCDNIEQKNERLLKEVKALKKRIPTNSCVVS